MILHTFCMISKNNFVIKISYLKAASADFKNEKRLKIDCKLILSIVIIFS